jgi:hypothetical protein
MPSIQILTDGIQCFFEVIEIFFGEPLPGLQADLLDSRGIICSTFFVAFAGQLNLKTAPVIRMKLSDHQILFRIADR